MTFQHARRHDTKDTLPLLPGWAASGQAQSPEIVVFRSGAALSVLDQLVSDPGHGVPVRLLANRLALGAAAATSKLEGRLARETDIRDAFHLAPAGAARGPDGDLLAFWREAVRFRANGIGEITELVGAGFADAVGGWLEAGQARAQGHGPLAGCVAVLRAVLNADDRAERIACLLSDIVLAQALGWAQVLPVTALRLRRADLAADGPGAATLRMLEALEAVIHQARDLARRAEALRAVAPKLRAKGSDAAVDLFLREDAVAPAAMLSPRIRGTKVPMTARAARRFCDRLVELGVAQELTGRASFRLYGVAP